MMHLKPTINVELIYDADCPNIQLSRQQLLNAFAKVGVPAQWTEWERADPDAPAYTQNVGSPTILVNGQDVAGDIDTANPNCCRLYQENGRYQGVPPLSSIINMLMNAQCEAAVDLKPRTQARLAGLIAVLPNIAMAALPKVFCPACWPAYSALLGAMGLNFINYMPYMLPMTVLFLIIVLLSLAYRAKQRRGYQPFILGMLAATIVSIGKFHLASDAAMYFGITLLIAASVWNAWPRQQTHCSACNN